MSYQPKTGKPCHCRPGQRRDNCPDCEGTGQRIDFAAIRARHLEPAPLATLPDYPRSEAGFSWFTEATATRLVRANRKCDLPKLPGWLPARFQSGAFRFRYWGLKNEQGLFLTKNV